MSTSTAHAAITAIVAALRAADTTADIFDGPTLDGDLRSRAVYIGANLNGEDGWHDAITDGESEWATTGPTRDERYRIRCTAEASDGDDVEVSVPRAAAFELVALVETTLRTNPTVSTALQTAGVIWMAVEIKDAEQGYTEDDGPACRVFFDILVRARI